MIMIGGARGACGRTDHGIRVTAAKKASFKKKRMDDLNTILEIEHWAHTQVVTH